MSFSGRWMWRRLPPAIAFAVATLAVSVSTVSASSLTGVASRSVTSANVARAHVAAAPAVGAVLGGFTSQDWPGVIALSKNGKRIVVAAAGVVMSCTSGDQFAVEEGFTGVPIRRGKVQAVATIPPEAGTPLLGGSRSFSGRFNRTRSTFTGTWHLHLTFQTSGGQTDECDSGHVAFFAT